MKILLNIGMDGHDKSYLYIAERAEELFNAKYMDFWAREGSWEGRGEETMVLEIVTPLHFTFVYSGIETLCHWLNQDAIAVSSDNFDLLIYNPSYEGEKMKFNEKYFKR